MPSDPQDPKSPMPRQRYDDVLDHEPGTPLSDGQLDDLVAQADHGARHPAGVLGTALLATALIWSLFQLWIASPLPFMVGRWIPVLNDTETRAIHLSFAVFLGFLSYPAWTKAPRDRIPLYDWALCLAATFAAGYLFWFYDALATRPGLPTQFDLIVAGIGLVLLLEAARRTLGPALAIVALVFLIYIFFGDGAPFPEVIQWKGASLERALSHQWLTTQGVFGIALGVSAGFVFLFVLFGALLEAAGAGNYFIKVAFSLLGHLRGGPAKAAVVGSAMTGVISGSSIANVVTTGTFTVPLMKRVGFSAEKAGSVEVASSVNGQLTPPVMGAAAFLMVEYVGISYVDVIKHAVLPAVISYIALIYIVHLEAVKNNMPTLPRSGPAKSFLSACWGVLVGFVGTGLLAAVIYFGIGWTKQLTGDASPYVIGVLVMVAYLGLLFVAARQPEQAWDNKDADLDELPRFEDVFPTGLHYLLPIAVLVWFLIVERASPGLAAFWACSLMMFIALTQRPLKSLFRQAEESFGDDIRAGLRDLTNGLITGARNMVSIAIATAAAGIIVGTVTLTGIGQVMAEFVELISGGQLILMLVFVALISLVLGMGLPTTANYIVVSSLMAGVVVELGAQHGLIVPLIAVHLFVFYFGIMADVTPPVGLASFAAAAVSGGDPLKTGFQAFFYCLRTVLLPFLFIFNTDLLLIDVTWAQGIVVFVTATIAMLCFAAATQGYFFARCKLWECGVLLLVAFTLFRPGFWLDRLEPPFETVPATEIEARVAELPDGATFRLQILGETFDGKPVDTTVSLPAGTAASGSDSGASRLETESGLILRNEDGQIFVDDLVFNGPAEEAGLDFDFEVAEMLLERQRPPKEWFYLPALLVLCLLALWQRRRVSLGQA